MQVRVDRVLRIFGTQVEFPFLMTMIQSRLVFSRFFDIRGNLESVKEKPTRKTCFSREQKRLAPRIYQAKFCLAAFP